MSYKVNAEKGFKLLRSVSPPIIFINGMFASGKNEFIEKFKEEGFSVIKFQSVEQIQKYIKNRKGKFDHNSLIIDANLKDENIISNIFIEDFHNFTYIFIYPNNPTEFKQRILNEINNWKQNINQISNSIIDDTLENLQKKNITSDQLIDLSEFLKLNQEIYQKHLNFFDHKILTILS